MPFSRYLPTYLEIRHPARVECCRLGSHSDSYYSGGCFLHVIVRSICLRLRSLSANSAHSANSYYSYYYYYILRTQQTKIRRHHKRCQASTVRGLLNST